MAKVNKETKRQQMDKYFDKWNQEEVPINLEPKCEECWARCCLRMSVMFGLGDSMIELFSAHYGREITKVQFKINHRCEQLDENNLCKLFGKPERPEICDNWTCPERVQPHVLAIELDDIYDEGTGKQPFSDYGLDLTDIIRRMPVEDEEEE